MTVETRDPVCGMAVDPETARHTHEHAGTTYLFCCGGCQAAFQRDPDAFLGAGDGSPAAPAHSPAAAPAPPVGVGRRLRLPDVSRGARDRSRDRARAAVWRSSRSR